MESTLTLSPGSTGKWRITVKDAAGAAQSLASLTEAWFTIKQRLGDADPGIFQLTIGSGITVVDAAAGTLDVEATPAQTEALFALPDPHWSCRLKFVDATVSDPDGLSGSITIDRRATKAN